MCAGGAMAREGVEVWVLSSVCLVLRSRRDSRGGPLLPIFRIMSAMLGLEVHASGETVSSTFFMTCHVVALNSSPTPLWLFLFLFLFLFFLLLLTGNPAT